MTTPQIEAAIDAIILAKREHAAVHVRCAQMSELFTAACNERNAAVERVYVTRKVLTDLLDEAAGTPGGLL